MFKRRAHVDETPTETPNPSGKGRATPTRKEAEAARLARVKPPKTRREAAALERRRRAETRASANAGMQSGDERYLPARDKGPVRRFVRDFIDSRRSVAEFFLPLAIMIFVFSFLPPPLNSYAVLLWLVVIVLIVADSFFLTWRLKRQLRERFPDESHKGTTSYALLRSLQLRRLRLPKPMVKPGRPI